MLNNWSKITILLAAVALITFSGCGDFEDGPGFSLRTKRGRLSNTWMISEVFKNDTLQASSYVDSFTVNFERDGEFIYTEVENNNGQLGNVDYPGAWDFVEVDDEEQLAMIFDATSPLGAQVVIWRILRLANDELFVEYTEPDGDIIEIDFIPVPQ